MTAASHYIITAPASSCSPSKEIAERKQGGRDAIQDASSGMLEPKLRLCHLFCLFSITPQFPGRSSQTSRRVTPRRIILYLPISSCSHPKEIAERKRGGRDESMMLKRPFHRLVCHRLFFSSLYFYFFYAFSISSLCCQSGRTGKKLVECHIAKISVFKRVCLNVRRRGCQREK